MYTPYFICEYCGSTNYAVLNNPEQGMFVPCSCKEARKNRDREHYLEMERRKRMKRGS